MKRTDRMVLVALAGIAVVAAFWFGLLSPKRSELSQLDEKRAALQTSVEEQEQLAAAAAEAEARYSENYGTLVSIGKAAPTDDDTASLLVQTADLARGTKIKFDSLTLAAGGESASDAAATPPATDADTTTEESAATPVATAAPATEASAATLPIGAMVGTAGLPVMPYDLKFRGDFFEIANFMRELDGMVRVREGRVDVRGRLLTVDGFSLTADEDRGFPHLVASMHVTSFVAPPDQGITGGATDEAPPATLSAAPVPVSAP